MKTKKVKLTSGTEVTIRLRAGILGIRKMLRARPEWMANPDAGATFDAQHMTSEQRDQMIEFQVSQVCAHSVNPRYIDDEVTDGPGVSIDTLDDADFFCLVEAISAVEREVDANVGPLSETASS